jgi:(S)-2-hydroxy-acid oxidase
MTWEDAKIAAENKVDAIWVSNHGGRQLDTSPSSLDALPEIVNTLRPHHPEVAILFDSGIARGTDVFKALALGADLCFIGRATLWGLTYDGQNGVELALELLASELRTTMALAGTRNLKEISRSHLGYVKPGGGIQQLE